MQRELVLELIKTDVTYSELLKLKNQLKQLNLFLKGKTGFWGFGV